MEQTSKQWVASPQEIDRELRFLRSLGFDGAVVRGEGLVRVLGLPSADVLRKRHKAGHLAFLAKDGVGYLAHIEKLALYLAELRLRGPERAEARGDELAATQV